jgi:ABC-type xylose transport system permease subunit
VVSLGFILLQSACTWVMAVSGARLLIGLSALAAASGLNRPSSGFHADVIRVPMMIVAVAGSLINLYVIWRIRSLRARPSSQWRMASTPKGKIRAENFQIALAIITLILVIAEQATHLIVHNA